MEELTNENSNPEYGVKAHSIFFSNWSSFRRHRHGEVKYLSTSTYVYGTVS